MSNVPAAVKRQAKEAERQRAEYAAGIVTTAPPAPVQTETLPNFPNVGTVPPAMSALVTGQTPPSGTAPAPSPAPPAAPPVVNNPPETPQSYEQQYRVLMGKYNAEVPRLQAQIQQTEAIVNQALQQNQQLLNELRTRSTAPQTPPPAPQSLITKEERETYGEDLVDLIGRRAREEVLPLVQQTLQKELQPLRQSITQTARQTSQQAADRVYQTLDAQVPNWAVINNAPEFGAWLSVMEPFSGQTRQTALTQAFNSFDAGRVVAIFQAFLRENALGATSTGAPVAAETLLAPGASLGGSPGVAPGSGGGRIWLESEIQDFYSAVRRKKVSPQDYAAMQVELAAAAREGRIRPSRSDFHLNQR